MASAIRLTPMPRTCHNVSEHEGRVRLELFRRWNEDEHRDTDFAAYHLTPEGAEDLAYSLTALAQDMRTRAGVEAHMSLFDASIAALKAAPDDSELNDEHTTLAERAEAAADEAIEAEIRDRRDFERENMPEAPTWAELDADNFHGRYDD